MASYNSDSSHQQVCHYVYNCNNYPLAKPTAHASHCAAALAAHRSYFSSSRSLTTTTTHLNSPQAPVVPTIDRTSKLKFRLRHCVRAALHAAVFTALVLCLSGSIALTSAAVAANVAYSAESNTENAPVFHFNSLVLETSVDHTTSPQDTLVSAYPELFNSSAFLSSIISANNGSLPANVTATAASNINNNNSISAPIYGASNGLLHAGANAALITTSSAFDPLGDAPTDISIKPPQAGAADEEFIMPPVHTIIVSIVLLFVIIGTVIGNVLVCIAVCMVRKLRRPCNYLLVSLALSDLCVAVLVMPMALLQEVLERWSFGTLLCDIWVAFDVLCCTASILNLCAISVDRYLAITKPLEYGVKRTPRRMMLCVALVWLAAACISLPPLLILGNEHEDENGVPICTVCQNFAYQIYATLGSFYIPLAVMLFVYYQIFRAARRIVLEEKRAQTHLQHALNGTGSPPGNTDLGNSGNGQRNSSYGNTSLTYSTCGGLSGHSGGVVSGSSGLLGSPHQKKLRFQLAKEKKASTTLGIIMSAFTICWLPFFILALIRPFVESDTVHVPPSLSSLFLWLGYANSLLNPIIYATLNRDFRKPFQEILYFRCSSLNTMMRENYYQDQYGEPPSQRVMLGDERHGARESFL